MPLRPALTALRTALPAGALLATLFAAGPAAAQDVSDPDLKVATVGVTGSGPDLLATFKTTQGDIECKLYAKEAPKTVANFVGLAMGNKPYTDPKTGKETKGRFYDGTIFHRVIPNFMIQGGDPLGTGSGGPGFSIPDEINPTLKHDRGGMMSMANRGPGTGGSQFFLTEKATPWLDGKHAIFGVCKNVAKISRIARVATIPPNRPREDVTLTTLEIKWGKY